MFFVFNKDKMLSYVISFSTVIILLVMAFHLKQSSSFISVSTNSSDTHKSIQKDKEQTLNLIINKEWNEKDIDAILDLLSKNNFNANFYASSDWINTNEKLIEKIKNKGYKICTISQDNFFYDKNN